MRAYLISILWVLALIPIGRTVVSAAASKPTFFSNLDATIKVSGKKVTSRIVADRYFRLMARINIYGLYCDPGNKLGYSTRASILQRNAVQLERLATRVFGGEVAAYNRFERYRNEESLRFVRSDRNQVCSGSNEEFFAFTDLKPKQLEGFVNQAPFGAL